MLVELTEDSDRIVVHASYVEKDAVRAIPGSSWERDRWTVPRTWAACQALRGTFGDRLEVGPELLAWSEAEYLRRVAPSLALRSEVTPDASTPEYDPRLREFQRCGVRWLLGTLDGALLGDGLGAGKTVQLCTALRYSGLTRGVVVAPKSTLPAWRDHLEAWAALRPAVASGTPARRRKAIQAVKDGDADVVVIAWENLRHHSALAPYGGVSRTEEEARPKELNLLAPEFVVADELHRAKDPRSKVARALWSIGDAATSRLAATGTPVGNALDELWAVMRFVSPDEWPTKSKFVDRYCTKTWNRWGGLEVGGVNQETAGELYRFLDPRYRAMPKDVVLRDLPPVVGGLDDPQGPQLRFAEMGSKQARAFQQMQDYSVADLDGGRLLGTGALARAARLLQLASAYGEVITHEEPDPDGGPPRVRQSLKLSEPSCKLDALEELLAGELAPEPAVVVFTVSRQLARLAAARAEAVTGEPAVLVVGGQSDAEREEAITAFQTGRARVIVVTIQAGGTGITLTRARVAVYLQRDFSYINNFQSEGRVHRIGSEVHDSVLILDVVTPGTPDLHVLEVLRDKRDVASAVTRFDDLRALLSARTGVVG